MAGTLAPSAAAVLEREETLGTLARHLDDVRRTARGHLVLLGGEAGVGKTTVVRRFREGHESEVRVLWGSCDPLFTPRPLGPMLAIADDVGGELRTAVEAGAMPHELTAALAHELAAQPGTVLVLEDAHWADEATLDVLRLLARRIEAVPALVVVSYRDSEIDPKHPLRIVLGELATSGLASRLTIAPLSKDAVATLAEPHGVDPEALYRTTGGNPFFVVEVLAAGPGSIPATVRDAVFARAAVLDAGARELLETLSIVPSHAELWLLEALAGDAFESLDDCTASGMVAVADRTAAFRHELARLAIEDSLGPRRRIQLHARALALLRAPPDGPPDLARLAHHAEAAGDVASVLELAPAAAEHAAAVGAHREAAAHYARALRAGGHLPPAARADLLVRLAHECYVTDQYDVGIAALEEAIEHRRAERDRRGEGEALRWLSQFLWCPGRTAEAEQRAREAVAVLEEADASRELALAYATLAERCSSAIRVGEAVEWADHALRLGRRLDDAAVSVDASITLAAAGDDLTALERNLEVAHDAGLPIQVGRAHCILAALATARRDPEAAARYARAGLAFCSERGLELFRLYLLAYQARAELDRGRWTEAGELAEKVVRVPRTSTIPRITALVVLGLLRARRGDPGAWPALDEASELAEPTLELPRLAPASWSPGGAAQVAPPGARGRSRGRSSWPATRRKPRGSGARAAAPTRPRSRSRSPTPRPSFAVRSRCCAGWAPARLPPSWRAGCAGSARATCRADRAPPPAGTQPGSRGASSRCSSWSPAGSGTPRSRRGSSCRVGRSTTTSRRSCASSPSGRAARPPPRRGASASPPKIGSAPPRTWAISPMCRGRPLPTLDGSSVELEEEAHAPVRRRAHVPAGPRHPRLAGGSGAVPRGRRPQRRGRRHVAPLLRQRRREVDLLRLRGAEPRGDPNRRRAEPAPRRPDHAGPRARPLLQRMRRNR
ncbi:MAG TPA: AAA family ATPase [Gaiellaceae bacterium]|nr:AAA family ATPase [Gaiellaceae bacterium]